MSSGMTYGIFSVELLYGLFVSMLNIAIQALISVALIRYMRSLQQRSVKRHRVLALAGAMMATGAILTLCHMIQVWVWAAAYDVLGAVDRADAYYFAFVNFTTLGYGDIIARKPWRVIGPLTAANGMLMFGMSTALIFAVLTRAATVLQVYAAPVHRKSARRHKAETGEPPEASPEA